MSDSVRHMSQRLEHALALAAVRGLGRIPQSDIDKVLWTSKIDASIGTLRGALRESS